MVDLSKRPYPLVSEDSLDSPTMIALNTRIACEGAELAEKSYLDWCKRSGMSVEQWVVDYYRLYLKYRKKSKNPCDNYIDVPASARALGEITI